MMLRLGGNDFGKFHLDAARFLDGESMYLPSAATRLALPSGEFVELTNLNPPHFHLPMLALGALSTPVAAFIWMSVGLVIYIAALSWAWRAAPAPVPAAWVPLLLAWLVANAGTGGVFLTGQLTFHLAGGLVLFWSLARRERWVGAAVVWGLLASIKPFLLLFGPWLLLRGGLRPLAAGLVAAGALVGIGVVVFGTESYAAWFEALGAVNWHHQPLNASFYGVVDRALGEPWLFAPLRPVPGLVLPLGLLGLAGFSAFALLVTTGFGGRGHLDTDHSVLLLTLAANLASPLGWVYYLPLAFPMMLVGWRDASRPWLAVGAVLALVPTHALVLGQPSGALSVTLGSLHFWAALAFFIAFASPGLRSWRGRERTPSERGSAMPGPETLRGT
ncbi:MAG: hypothetical protein DRJ42_19945 [Deltaproteobacteria bacterium]|nr:MAG: hypothetical protein DRJ42_19945 [Deltaproteobacteria bacterium]